MSTLVQEAIGIPVSSQVSKFLTQPLKLLIGGKWVESASGQTFPVYNPATGHVIQNAASGESEDINRAVQAARQAFENGPWSLMY
ncbi:MAG: aldehyde dehydrogenase family protein [Iphinoe sp. HA4291-MV1]|jgi:phenylacetaldehyde dehydrogenase|nr:aldehyde dehydrogenase family protein [Iphinoe sp. HA4291-MV1]